MNIEMVDGKKICHSVEKKYFGFSSSMINKQFLIIMHVISFTWNTEFQKVISKQTDYQEKKTRKIYQWWW